MYKIKRTIMATGVEENSSPNLDTLDLATKALMAVYTAIIERVADVVYREDIPEDEPLHYWPSMSDDKKTVYDPDRGIRYELVEASNA